MFTKFGGVRHGRYAVWWVIPGAVRKNGLLYSVVSNDMNFMTRRGGLRSADILLGHQKTDVYAHEWG